MTFSVFDTQGTRLDGENEVKRKPRFEIARSVDKQFFARYISSNGKEVWKTSETYRRRAGARRAIYSWLAIVGDPTLFEIEDLTSRKLGSLDTYGHGSIKQ